MAQGGRAALMYSPDSYEKHIQDTLIAGDGIAMKKLYRLVSNRNPQNGS